MDRVFQRAFPLKRDRKLVRRLQFVLFSTGFFLSPAIVLSFTPPEVREWTHKFGKTTLGDPALVMELNRSARLASSTADGFRFKWQYGKLSSNGAGMRGIFSLPGDFDVRLDCTVGNFGKPETGRLNGIRLSLDFRDNPRTRLSVSRVCDSEGNQIVRLNLRSETGSVNLEESWGTPAGFSGIRITRDGGNAKIFVLAGKKEIVKKELSVPTTDVFPLKIRADSGDGKANLDVTLRQLRVKGLKFPVEVKPYQAPIPGWVWGLAASVGGLFLAMALNVIIKLRSKE